MDTSSDDYQSPAHKRGMELFREFHAKGAQAMQSKVGDIAPDLMRLIAEFPFAAVYDRPQLSLRERQLVTIAALATRGDAPSQLGIHIGIGLHAGLTQEEIVEIMIQLTPYTGFPAAINGLQVAKEAFKTNEE